MNKSVEWNSVEETYYQKSRDVILNRVKDYYENVGRKKQRLKEYKKATVRLKI